jgi:chromosome partitioning protein
LVTRNAERIDAWAVEQELEHLGSIKEAQAYSRCLEQGLSIFDFPRNRSIEGFLIEWQRICAWIDEVLAAQTAAAQAASESANPQPAQQSSVLPRPAPAAAIPPTLPTPSVLPRPSILSAALAQRRAEAAAAVANANAVETPAFLRA